MMFVVITPIHFYKNSIKHFSGVSASNLSFRRSGCSGFRYRSSLLTSLRSVAVAASRPYHPSRNKANLSLDGLLLCHCRAWPGNPPFYISFYIWVSFTVIFLPFSVMFLLFTVTFSRTSLSFHLKKRVCVQWHFWHWIFTVKSSSCRSCPRRDAEWFFPAEVFSCCGLRFPVRCSILMRFHFALYMGFLLSGSVYLFVFAWVLQWYFYCLQRYFRCLQWHFVWHFCHLQRLF